MWEQQESFSSMFNINKEKKKDANWYYKLSKKESGYIISLVWTPNLNTWQVCVCDKKRFGEITHRFYENNLDVAKLKGIVKARQLGWNVEVV